MIGQDWAGSGLGSKGYLIIAAYLTHLREVATPFGNYHSVYKGPVAHCDARIMEVPQGKLCQTCKATLGGETYIHNWEERQLVPGRPHHKKYTDLTASKNGGCFICIWLWEKHVPPVPTADNEFNGSTCEPFQTFCRIFSRPAIQMYFAITCSWAPDLELNGMLPPSHAIG